MKRVLARKKTPVEFVPIWPQALPEMFGQYKLSDGNRAGKGRAQEW
jgi:hypothetical protein